MLLNAEVHLRQGKVLVGRTHIELELRRLGVDDVVAVGSERDVALFGDVPWRHAVSNRIDGPALLAALIALPDGAGPDAAWAALVALPEA